MLHAWDLLMLACCLAVAALAFFRGLAGLLVDRGVLGLLEALVLVLAGGGGLVGAVLVFHAPG